ncbi:MAG TPA: hypothetical protein ENH11_01330, partial [Candidatus Acetothermia bacterium]|nr:hypothetical protein [Candidatus Acetothermia bacterium]
MSYLSIRSVMHLNINFVSVRYAGRRVLRLVAAAVIVCAAWIGGTSAVSAETLRQSLVAAYMTNPTLNAERARLRAIDEEVSRARSNFRPSVSGDLETGYRKINPNAKGGGVATGGTHHPTGYSITVNKTLFRGLRTLNAIRQAEANIQAGRESLRAVEQSTLLDAVTAFMNVVRDRAIVRLREGNVRVLSEQKKATE